jgi:adenylate kinase
LLTRRADDAPETFSARLREYAEKTQPLIEYYEKQGILEHVDSARTPELVFRSIEAIVEAR